MAQKQKLVVLLVRTALASAARVRQPVDGGIPVTGGPSHQDHVWSFCFQKRYPNLERFPRTVLFLDFLFSRHFYVTPFIVFRLEHSVGQTHWILLKFLGLPTAVWLRWRLASEQTARLTVGPGR